MGGNRTGSCIFRVLQLGDADEVTVDKTSPVEGNGVNIGQQRGQRQWFEERKKKKKEKKNRPFSSVKTIQTRRLVTFSRVREEATRRKKSLVLSLLCRMPASFLHSLFSSKDSNTSNHLLRHPPIPTADANRAWLNKNHAISATSRKSATRPPPRVTPALNLLSLLRLNQLPPHAGCPLVYCGCLYSRGQSMAH